MKTTPQLITLPSALAQLVQAKVHTGESVGESEVTRDSTAENWLQHEVATAYDALEKQLDSARSASQIRARLRAERQKLA